MRKFVMPLAVLALVSTGAMAGTKTSDGIEVRDWLTLAYLSMPYQRCSYHRTRPRSGAQRARLSRGFGLVALSWRPKMWRC